MRRRHFMRLSGLSTAALFFGGAYSIGGGAGTPLHFPTAVAILREGEWVKLGGSKERWSFQQLVVSLGHGEGSMRVRVQAPGVAIEKVRLSWDQGFGSAASYLGDEW